MNDSGDSSVLSFHIEGASLLNHSLNFSFGSPKTPTLVGKFNNFMVDGLANSFGPSSHILPIKNLFNADNSNDHHNINFNQMEEGSKSHNTSLQSINQLISKCAILFTPSPKSASKIQEQLKCNIASVVADEPLINSPTNFINTKKFVNGKEVVQHGFADASQNTFLSHKILLSPVYHSSPLPLVSNKNLTLDVETAHCLNLSGGKSSKILKSLSEVWVNNKNSNNNATNLLSDSPLKAALNNAFECPNLIGDFTRAYALPTLHQAKNPELKAISSETLRDLLANRFQNMVDNFTIIDCRFPYEFEGGHIKNAINIFTHESLLEHFFKKGSNNPGRDHCNKCNTNYQNNANHNSSSNYVPSTCALDLNLKAKMPLADITNLHNNLLYGSNLTSFKNLNGSVSIENKLSLHSDISKTTLHTIYIFHCEFSQERGPKLYQFLRNYDRQLNKDTYPALNYPEMYVLEGGYKNFYEKFPALCEPQSYKPMLHSGHKKDLKHFKAKSKSWTGGDKNNPISRPSLKKRNLFVK